MTYILPTSAPLPLEPLLQTVIVGVTALPGALVRPSWQPDPPLRPARTTDWCGFRVANLTADDDSVLTTQGATGRLDRNESGEWAVSMYGPGCQAMCGVLRDGLQIPQNREAMRAQGVVIVRSERIVHVPELINDVWFDRADITFQIAREVRRAYSILSFVSASGVTHAQDLTNPFQTP